MCLVCDAQVEGLQSESLPRDQTWKPGICVTKTAKRSRKLCKQTQQGHFTTKKQQKTFTPRYTAVKFCPISQSLEEVSRFLMENLLRSVWWIVLR